MPGISRSKNHLAVTLGIVSTMDLPIICTLSEAELRQRRDNILRDVRLATVKTTELPRGYAYEFVNGPEILATLARLIAAEHECCPFLTFRISAEAGQKSVTLEITGSSEEAKPVIADFFGSKSPVRAAP
jgi:hypothetical protein